MNLYQSGLAVFSEWLNDAADVQHELLLSSNPNADRTKSSYNETTKDSDSTFATSATNTPKDNSETARVCAERWQTSYMELRKINKNERRRKKTKGKIIEILFQRFVRRISDENLFWHTLRRQWLQKKLITFCNTDHTIS